MADCGLWQEVYNGKSVCDRQADRFCTDCGLKCEEEEFTGGGKYVGPQTQLFKVSRIHLPNSVVLARWGRSFSRPSTSMKAIPNPQLYSRIGKEGIGQSQSRRGGSSQEGKGRVQRWDHFLPGCHNAFSVAVIDFQVVAVTSATPSVPYSVTPAKHLTPLNSDIPPPS
ncbi:hypothetical protein ECG_03599 [Echinococcus granulosus]|nr:hypothetical protein ECG_03599 [Echinococcus granulosus]